MSHEHEGRPTFLFPVVAEYIGERGPLPEWDRSYEPESHALIYTDGCVALTLYEYVYATWSARTGEFWSGKLWRKGELRLANESLAAIKAHCEKVAA